MADFRPNLLDLLKKAQCGGNRSSTMEKEGQEIG
jgi:hypothetical protein